MRTKIRLLSLLLCGALLFSLCSPTAFAEAQTIQDSGQITADAGGLCEHHIEHTPDCGYTEGEPETPCIHEHVEDCYTEVTECVHEHTADCYQEETGSSVSGNNATPSNAEEREPEKCDHVCNVEIGCITKELNCQHEHGGECGYVPAKEGTPCGYVCEICNAEGDGETATPSNAEETVTVERIQAMIDGLPDVDGITEDNAEEVKEQLEAIDEAKAQLSDEEIGALDFTRYIEAAAALEQLLYGTATPSNAVMPLADYDGPAIVIGTDHLEGGQGSSVYFGRYQQTSVGEKAPGEGTEGVDWIYSNTANQKDQGPYYLKDPVKWRVLSNNMSGQLFLLSDQNLDVFRYHVDWENVTWGTSTMRSWLNGYGVSENTGGASGIDYTNDNFLDNAFSDEEQGAIAETTVVNRNNSTYDAVGGSDTNDKIFLLSTGEVANSDYGFTGDTSRVSTNTAFVTGGGQNGSDIMGADDHWWLRTSHPNDATRAMHVSVWGGLGDNSAFVFGSNIAVRPAFNLNLDAVLFTSAAAGGKDDAAVDSDLTAVGTGTGEWKLTLKDDSRGFVITSNTTVSIEQGKTADISYSGAQTGNNEYVSAMIADANGTILYYGRVAQGSESGTASVTIPAGLQPGSYTLKMFNEQYNGEKQTDYASAFEDISLTVSSDTTAPALSGGSATHTSETTATVMFTSDEAGTYYYEVVESSEAAPTINITGMGTSCARGENTISLDSLTGAGAKDIYIVVKDAAGNLSSPALKMTIPAYVAPSYGISATPSSLDFGSKTEGYTTAPTEQTVTITNTGNQSVTVNLPTSTNYTITAGTGFISSDATLSPNGTATFTVQPNTGLAVGSHNETLSIYGSDGVNASVSLSFVVTEQAHVHEYSADWVHTETNHWRECSCGAKTDEAAHVYDGGQDTTCNTCDYVRVVAPATYILTVELNGGSGSTVGGKYAEGAVISIDAGSRSNYRFNGWTTSNGGSFANASSASTTFTMPAANTTITANWEQESTQPTEYIVTVQTNGNGTASASPTSATEGEKITLTAKADSGYHFKEWQVVSGNATISGNSFTMPAGNVTVKAIFEKDRVPSGGGGSSSSTTYYSLTFESNGGSKIEKVTEKSGNTVDLSGYLPTREGYDFNGWYSDKGLTRKITEIELNSNKTVYAAWTERKTNPDTGAGTEKPGTVTGNPFSDIKETDWFYKSVMFVYENGLMTGTSADIFDPNSNATRAQLAVIFYRMEGSPKVEGKNSFSDVEQGWYYDAVTWAEQSGLMNGYENGKFGSGDAITREQLAAIFYRYAQYKGYDVAATRSIDLFTDKDKVSEWAKQPLIWAVSSGIVNGTGDNLLSPQETANRAQIVAMLHRFRVQ